MIDWLSSMSQTFEYYIVDPLTWGDMYPLNSVKSSTISRDCNAETLGSATFDITEPVGEYYIRVYLVTIQNGVRERFPLGTFLIQTPSTSFNGKVQTVSVDAYTPLLELKEKCPPIGYYIPEGGDPMYWAQKIAHENMRAPVIGQYKLDDKDTTVLNDAKLDYNFVADTSDTWLTFITDLILDAKYTFDLDEMGRVLFAPKQDAASLQPVWTYTDDNSSILLPDVTIDHDMYGIPNVIEVVYSKGSVCYQVTVKNDDPNSPISTISRGREIVCRDTDPDVIIDTSDRDLALAQLEEYARQSLRDMSVLEHTVTYTHGYCPVRVGDCVRLNYKKAGLNGVKAKVISQSIKCQSGCQVSETAVFTKKLWG